MSKSEEGSCGDDVTLPLGKLLPLNSRRLTAAYLKHNVQSLELPTAGSVDETRQLIEGKLQETWDSANVQVVVDKTASITVKLTLMDDENIFHEASPFNKPAKEKQPDDDVLQRLADTEQNEQLTADLASAQESLTRSEQRLLDSKESYTSFLHQAKSVSYKINECTWVQNPHRCMHAWLMRSV